MATAPRTHSKPRPRDWRQTDRLRGTAHQRGYGHRWAEYSRHYRIEYPLCRECEERGRTTPTDHVDHIVPVTGPDDPLFWPERNHQPLCQPCHSRKTVRERNWRNVHQWMYPSDRCPPT